jgi:alpha-beta hydrolase superfamily lysophospholipase
VRRRFDAVDEFTAPDGARLAMRCEEPEGTLRGAVLLTHGWGEHTGRYPNVAAWLAARGLAVWAIDQRGAGRSPGPRGHIARFAQYLSDIVALRRLVAARTPGPLLLLGHSHGGLITLRYLQSAPKGVAGAIITSPFVAVAVPIPRWKVALADLLADLAPSLPFPTGLDLALLSTDPAVVEAARRDPLGHQVMTPRAWHEIREAQRGAVADRGRVAVPLFLGLAGDDRIASTPATEALAAGLGGDVTVRVYPGMYHEILNEREKDRVFADVAPWIERILGAAA